MVVSSYQKLKNEVEKLKRLVHIRDLEIQGAHESCDNLDVPQSKMGAFVGHRLFWYSEGKRESFKTRENDQGYPSEEFERRKGDVERVRTPPAKQENKKTYKHTMNILGDE